MIPYVQPELDFGKVPLTLDSIEIVQWVEHQPSNKLNSDIIDIVVPRSDDYIDLSRSTLRVNYTAVDMANANTPLVTGDVKIANNLLARQGLRLSPDTLGSPDICCYQFCMNPTINLENDLFVFIHS